MDLKRMLKEAANRDDVLAALGLERRHSGFARIASSVGLIAAGAAVGAGLALLFAPRPGFETREQLGQRVSQYGTRVKEALREARQGRGQHVDIESDIEEVGGNRGI